MNKLRLLPFSVLALLLIAATDVCAQEFEKWEGKPNVQEGNGGTKKVVNGIDFWADGSPPRKFVLLGYIQDRRHKTGLVGKIRMSRLESDVADAAKKAGGDAVILVSTEAETIGMVGAGNTNTQAHAYGNQNNAYGSSNSFSVGSASAVQKQDSKFAVIKYVIDEPASPAHVSTQAPDSNAPKQ